MERLRKAERVLVAAESLLLCAILSFMVVTSFAQVVLRQAFSSGVLWADTLLRHLVLWLGFLGAAVAAARGKHFAWEGPGTSGGGRLRKGLGPATGASVAAALARASWLFFADEKATGNPLFTIGRVTVPAWTLWTILPAGFALVSLHGALRAAEAWAGQSPER